MGRPRYFKIQFRLKDSFVSLAYVAVAMTFVRLSIWLATPQEFTSLAWLAGLAAIVTLGAGVGALFRKPGWGAVVAFGISAWILIWFGPVPRHF